MAVQLLLNSSIAVLLVCCDFGGLQFFVLTTTSFNNFEGRNMESKQQLLNRLRSIEGHVRSVERMVGEDVYCIDILHQTRAIQRALERFNHLILQRHLNTCVTTAIRNDDPDERERVIGELLQVFDASTKV